MGGFISEQTARTKQEAKRRAPPTPHRFPTLTAETP
jgi:hypothetical protein